MVLRRPRKSDSEDEEEGGKIPTRPRLHHRRRRDYHPPPPKRLKRVHFTDDEDGEDEAKFSRKVQIDDDDDDGGGGDDNDDDYEVELPEEEAEEEELPKPVGEVVRVSGKGRGLKKHFVMFEYDGLHFQLEDPVLLTPEDKKQKPYVAIIKDITQSRDGNMMVAGQWFYRSEEAEKSKGGSWQARDTRELFYSFHRDDVPAESVMHKCVVHFVPLNKQIPSRKHHPGFIIQRVYDTVEKKLWKLTDKDYEDGKQEEIDVMVQKTISRLGELPNIETEDTPVQLEEQIRSKRLLKKRQISTLDVSREDEWAVKSPRLETPGSCPHTMILAESMALTKDSQRDKWLAKLLQAVEYVCSSPDKLQDKNKGDDGIIKYNGDTNNREKSAKSNVSLTWPDSAVSAVVALEKASHDALSSDYSKYNQKLRSLWFNLKPRVPKMQLYQPSKLAVLLRPIFRAVLLRYNHRIKAHTFSVCDPGNPHKAVTMQCCKDAVENTELLARRLLNGEIDPLTILSMQPNELKEGLTQEEITRNQPEEPTKMQITDARCQRCNEKKVGLVDIIQAGHGDRYQLECIACGNTWYASRDEAAMLTIDGPSVATNVGAAPWATSKFETVERNESPWPS